MPHFGCQIAIAIFAGLVDAFFFERGLINCGTVISGVPNTCSRWISRGCPRAPIPCAWPSRRGSSPKRRLAEFGGDFVGGCGVHFQIAARAASGRRLLRHACQIEHGVSPYLFGEDRTQHWHHLRSDHRARWVLHPAGLSRPVVACTLQGSRDWQVAGVCHQPDDASRWQVELFFKWIKQHLRIKRFFGTSENAVKTQRCGDLAQCVWIAVSVYVLVQSSRGSCNSMPHATLCYRSCRSPFSRRCPCSKPFRLPSTLFQRVCRATS